MHPAIHVAVCGIKTAEQIAEVVGAAGKSIDREDYFAVRNALAGGYPPKIADAQGTRK
jgi:predicted oxidoreductase